MKKIIGIIIVLVCLFSIYSIAEPITEEEAMAAEDWNDWENYTTEIKYLGGSDIHYMGYSQHNKITNEYRYITTSTHNADYEYITGPIHSCTGATNTHFHEDSKICKICNKVLPYHWNENCKFQNEPIYYSETYHIYSGKCIICNYEKTKDKYEKHNYINGICACGKEECKYCKEIKSNEYETKLTFTGTRPEQRTDKPSYRHYLLYECPQCKKTFSLCKDCNFKFIKIKDYFDSIEHYSGRHTCRGECTVCGQISLYTEKHSGNIIEPVNDYYHINYGRCKCGVSVKQTSEDHNYINGICSVCNYKCTHSYYDNGICHFCKYECPHSKTTDIWIYDDDTHYLSSTCKKCNKNIQTEKESHDLIKDVCIICKYVSPYHTHDYEKVSDSVVWKTREVVTTYKCFCGDHYTERKPYSEYQQEEAASNSKEFVAPITEKPKLWVEFDDSECKTTHNCDCSNIEHEHDWELMYEEEDDNGNVVHIHYECTFSK